MRGIAVISLTIWQGKSGSLNSLHLWLCNIYSCGIVDIFTPESKLFYIKGRTFEGCFLQMESMKQYSVPVFFKMCILVCQLTKKKNKKQKHKKTPRAWKKGIDISHNVTRLQDISVFKM